MNDLVDEERTTRLAEQYSDRIRLDYTITVCVVASGLRQYVVKRQMKQRLNWIAVKHRARTVWIFFSE